MTNEIEMREMVLTFAREQAKKVYEQVKESDSLDFARVSETIDVGGIEWHVNARYWTDGDFVKVEGHPATQESQAAVLAGPFGLLFSSEAQEAPEGSFSFTLPAGWL